MADTGIVYPGTAATVAGDGSLDWASVANVKAQDSVYASVYLNSITISYRIKATNFGFAIPANAAILGVIVTIYRYANSLFRISDYQVQLIDNNSNIVGTNKALGTTWPNSNTAASYGDASDTWAASPTSTMVNSANFGVAFEAQISIGISKTAYVDSISVQIYYTPDPFPAGYQPKYYPHILAH